MILEPEVSTRSQVTAPNPESTTLCAITRVIIDRASTRASSVTEQLEDPLAIEEPLEIRVELGPRKNRTRKSISITMRTPGNDFELAAGFLFTEGILRERAQIERTEFCGPSGNVVRVDLNPKVELNLKSLERHFYTTSSCGVCGKSSIEALRTQNPFAAPKAQSHSVRIQTLYTLTEKLRAAQSVFEITGGLHGCAAFDFSGELEIVREDVGRHNALDKLIGNYFFSSQLPLTEKILLVSGRASFELVQKAAMAGFPILAAVGAPSSLAVELATQNNMTLIGFLRDQRLNIYSGKERVIL